MKRLKKISLWTLAVLLLLAGLVSLLGYLHADEIKSYVVNRLNARLNSRMETSGMDFSIWKHFPSASVSFSDVKLHGALPDNVQGDADTLLQARELYFSMSLWDVIRGKPVVQSIVIENGTVKVMLDSKGRGNYHVFTSNTEGNAELDLSEILLSEINFLYSDAATNDLISLHIEQAEASGELLSDDFTLFANINGIAKQVHVAGLSFPLQSKEIKLHGNIRVNSEQELLTFREVDLGMAGMDFAISGTTGYGGDGMAELSVNGKDLDIRSFLSLLPAEYQQQVDKYASEGDFYFNASITGPTRNGKSPDLNIGFGVKDGQVRYDGGIPLEHLNATGEFSGKGAEGRAGMSIYLKEFSARMEQSSFQGEGSISNFKNPQLALQLKGDFILEELTSLFPTDSIPRLNGKVFLDASFSGPVKSREEYTIEDFVTRSKTSGEVILTSVSVIPQTGNPFTGLNGKMLFDNNDIIVRELAGNIGNSDFFLKGFFRNLISWFFIPDNKLVVDADFSSKKLDLSSLISQGADAGSANNLNLDFTTGAHFYLRTNLEQVSYHNFEGRAVKGKFVMKDRKLKAEGVQFSAFSGDINVKGEVDATELNDILITCAMSGTGIELPELFKGLDNFGQEVLQSQHLKGKANVELEFTAATDTSLQLRGDEVFASASISVANGELINFEPMKKLSRFVEVEELNHIRFGLLENKIHIRDRKVFIPSMHISSNAMSLDMSGVHSFDNEIDYRFKILLSELLAGKARKARKENDEFGIYEVQDGKRQMALYLAMKGTVENPRFTYDKIGLSDKIKKDVRDEKQTVKSMLNKEFGMFENDSTLKGEDKNEPVKFDIEWEDSDKDEEKKESDPSRFEKKESKFKKWMKNLPGEEVQ